MYFKQFVEETPRLERSLNDTAAALRIQFIFLFVWTNWAPVTDTLEVQEEWIHGPPVLPVPDATTAGSTQ